MRPTQFFIQLTLFSALVASLLFGILSLTQLSTHLDFVGASLTFFIVLCLFIYLIAWLGHKRKNPMLNFRLGVLFNFLKIFNSIIFILVYKHLYQPDSTVFVLLFFLIYLLYTIFELYFLIRLFRSE